MTGSDIARTRLANQRLTGPKFAKPEEVVNWLGAVQAQEYPGGLWSIGLRMREATEASVEQAVFEKKIVRTWPMRGTLHFVPAEDAGWMLKLLAPRVISKFASYYKKLGLTDTVFAKSREVIAHKLEGGQQLTRPELYELLKHNGIPTQEMRGLFILGRLAMEGFLIFGARRGKQQTFTLLDEWIPRSKNLSREQSINELTKRYFTSHGPATVQDLMWWSGLTKAEVNQGLEEIQRSLTSENIAGQTYWLALSSGPRATTTLTAYFLQAYDEFLIAYKDRSASLGAHPSPLAAFANGFYSTIVVDGRVVGTWKRTIQSKTVTIETRFFRPLNQRERQAIQAASERYGRFIQMPVEFSLQ